MSFPICFPDFWPQVDSIYGSMMLQQWKCMAIVVEKSFQELIIMEQVKFFCQKQNKTHFLIELVLLKLQAVNLCVKIFLNVEIFFFKNRLLRWKKYLNCTMNITIFCSDKKVDLLSFFHKYKCNWIQIYAERMLEGCHGSPNFSEFTT